MFDWTKRNMNPKESINAPLGIALVSPIPWNRFPMITQHGDKESVGEPLIK